MTELSPRSRLGLFGAGLAVVLVASLAVGRATGDVAQAGEDAASTMPGHEAQVETADTDTGALGTTLSAGGLRLEVPVTTLPPMRSTPFAFRVLDADGSPVTSYDLEQGKRMHLVIVSRDLSRHAHVHPELGADGTWRYPITLSPGSYRAVADFSTGGVRRTLAVDLTAPGPLEVAPLPAPAHTALVEDLRVELVRERGRMSFTAYDSRGKPVVPEPFLDARGHLVAFRDGDLAYVHVHPRGGLSPSDGATTTYDVELPGPGLYRLFLELKVDGTVLNVPFTIEEKP